MQRDPVVGRVQRLPAPVRLGVDSSSRAYERRDVRDRVPDPEAGAGPLDEQGLVEVLGAGRIDSHERQSAQVVLGQRHRGRGPLGFRQHVGRKLLAHLELGGDRRQARAKRRRIGVVQSGAAAWHKSSW